MNKYVDLEKYGLNFKHIISGPAPVGRILNYTKMIGEGKLNHKNGNRNLIMEDNIASAWCSEFMCGLGICYYEEEKDKDIYPLKLTNDGKKLYLSIKNSNNFDESKNPIYCKNELINYSIEAYDLFFNIFKKSIVCKNLRLYILNSGTPYFNKRSFKDEYYKTFKEYYLNEEYIIGNRTTTAKNRVPSLLQLCDFFECLRIDKDEYYFNFNRLGEDNITNNILNIDSKTIKKIGYDSIIESIDDYIENEKVQHCDVYDEAQDLSMINNRIPQQGGGIRSNRYKTDPRLSKTVLKKCEYKCQYGHLVGNEHITFKSKFNVPYLEAHHLIPMKAQKDFGNINLDREENIVGLCPMCHSIVHYGSKEEKILILKKLYDDRAILLARCQQPIIISFDDLINKYYK